MVEGFLKSSRHWLWMQKNKQSCRLAAKQRLVWDMGVSMKRGNH